MTDDLSNKNKKKKSKGVKLPPYDRFAHPDFSAELMNHQYTARDIYNILHIDPNKLFYWVQTKRLIKPEVEGKGRGKVSKFSFENLIQLSLIQSLTSYGIELNYIKDIMESSEEEFSLGRVYLAEKVGKINIYKTFKKHEEKIRKRGLVLLVYRENYDTFYQQQFLPLDLIEERLVDRILRNRKVNANEILLINMLELINDLEIETWDYFHREELVNEYLKEMEEKHERKK